MPFVEDMTPFFNVAEFASAAVWGSVTANVILDKPTEDVLGGEADSEQYAITLAAGPFDTMRKGASLTVDGVAFTARKSPNFLSDGRLIQIELTKV